MTLEDAEHFKNNAINVLKDNTQYATAKATEKAFDVLIAILKFTTEKNGKKTGNKI